MRLRVLIAGVVGAIAMMTWDSIAHVATPLDAAGMAPLPNEAAVVSALQRSIGHRSGLYIFPDPDKISKEQAASTPHGLLLYHPSGPGALVSGGQVGLEFLFELIESLIAAILLAQTALAEYFSRVAFVIGIGLAAVLTTNASYWVFYGFPGIYTVSYAFVDLVRYLIAGLVIAAITGRGVPHGRS